LRDRCSSGSKGTVAVYMLSVQGLETCWYDSFVRTSSETLPENAEADKILATQYISNSPSAVAHRERSDKHSSCTPVIESKCSVTFKEYGVTQRLTSRVSSPLTCSPGARSSRSLRSSYIVRISANNSCVNVEVAVGVVGGVSMRGSVGE
jgi:hypothetical protein